MRIFDRYFENLNNAPDEDENLENMNTLQLYWYVVRTFFWKIILLNLLFILTSLLIVTIPASIAAMTRICMKWVMGEHVEMTQDYFKEFKASFWKSWVIILCGAVMIGLLVLASFAYYYLLNGTLMSIIMLLCVVWALWIFTVGCYAFSILESTDLPLGTVLKNAVLISVTSFGTTFLIVILPGLAYFLCVMFFPATMVLLLIGILAFTQLGVCALALKPIKKYILCPQNEE